MLLVDYNSPTSLKNFLDDKNMSMQKKFGQNFLINSSARQKLADVLDLSPGMKVWEVGPGLGALTHEILQKGARLTAFEIDKGFCSILPTFFDSEYLSQTSGAAFNLIPGDVLKTWKDEFKKNGAPERFFANLPYNVATAIIVDMISEGLRFDKAVITVQKEVAMRMTAKPGNQNYSSFSVLCQWAYDISNVIDLSGGSFWPRPNVDSRAVKFVKKENFPRCKNDKYFMEMLRSLFLTRRKTIKNNLTQFYSNTDLAFTVLNKANINPQLRAEKLSVDELLALSDISFEIHSQYLVEEK
ncbi:MAG: ribosomal RNA small subunit methyltransferase A [Treponema sp.]|nr:ribosomal RNA small subunit methyltransferase A [Treponema sp.]